MLSVEVTYFALFVYALQVVLLPVQVAHYIFNFADCTRRRYLILSLSFVLFNSLWLLPQSFLEIEPLIRQKILIYAGIVLITVVYRYLVKEVNITTGKLVPRTLFIILIAVQFFRALAIFNLNQTDDFFVEISFVLIFTVVVMLFFLRGIVHLYLKKNGIQHAMFFAAIGSFIVACFLPLVIFCSEGQVPEYFLINAVFGIVSIAYLQHYFIELRSKSFFPKRKREVAHLNLDDRFFKVPKTVADLGLPQRQQVIVSLLLQGKSYQEIAAQLFLSYSTVRGHSAKAFQKAGITGDKKIEKFREKFGNS